MKRSARDPEDKSEPVLGTTLSTDENERETDALKEPQSLEARVAIERTHETRQLQQGEAQAGPGSDDDASSLLPKLRETDLGGQSEEELRKPEPWSAEVPELLVPSKPASAAHADASPKHADDDRPLPKQLSGGSRSSGLVNNSGGSTSAGAAVPSSSSSWSASVQPLSTPARSAGSSAAGAGPTPRTPAAASDPVTPASAASQPHQLEQQQHPKQQQQRQQRQQQEQQQQPSAVPPAAAAVAVAQSAVPTADAVVPLFAAPPAGAAAAVDRRPPMSVADLRVRFADPSDLQQSLLSAGPRELLLPAGVRVVLDPSIAYGEVLRCGAQGAVIAARWRYGPVAVKLLDVRSPAFCIINFQREVLSLFRAQGVDGVVQMQAVLVDAQHNKLGIITELLNRDDWQTLFDALEARRLAHPLDTGFTEKDVLIMLFCVGRTLTILHDRSVVHGDLKPRSLMMSKNGPTRYKIVDFGVSLISEFGTAGDGTDLQGTMFYMAPEQVKNAVEGVHRVQATPAVDVFTLGLIAAEMLVNHAGPVGFIYARHIAEHEVTDVLLRRLLREMLSFDAADRPTAEEIMDACAERLTELDGKAPCS